MMGTWLIWFGLFVGALVFVWAICRAAARGDERMRRLIREEAEKGGIGFEYYDKCFGEGKAVIKDVE